MTGLGLNVGSHVGHFIGGGRDFFFGNSLGFALNGQTFLDEGLENLAAFFLSLGKRAQTGKPDLLGRFFDRTGKLRR